MNGEETSREARDVVQEFDAVPTMDEAAFIRRAERRSVRRTVRVSLLVVLGAVVLLASGWLLWGGAIDGQANRIRNYYEPLVRMIKPNNEVSGGRVIRDFPGASMVLTAYRRIGDSVVPAGEITVRFYPWGGETFEDPVPLSDITDGQLVLVPGTTNELLLLEPPVGGGDASEVWGAAERHDPFLTTYANARKTAIERLEAAPASSTVEIAVSFDDVMTLEQLQKRIGSDLRLAWGALRVGGAGDMVDGDTGEVSKAGTTWWPHFPGDSSTVGAAFDVTGEGPPDESAEEREATQLSEFGYLASEAPGRWGNVLQERGAYLKANGAKYYAAVVVGSPEAALALAKSPDVSTVTLGAVTMHWQ